ncbi:MAG: hypothetical protein K0U98_23555 [Deltaproteobacteria bacterium]|nr:hypothetical protein [Deltaproteobacteria bacterium]
MTPPKELEALAGRARRAYELGRLRSQLHWATLALAPLALGLHFSGKTAAMFGTCILLSLLILALRWRGQQYAQGVLPGLTAGLLALSVPVLACSSGLCPARPSPLLLTLCVGGGVMAGAVVTLRALSTQCCSVPFLLAAASVAAVTASLTCAVAGVSGILGMILGLAVASSPVLVLARVS